MELTRLEINNFKGLRFIEIPTSRFVCLIGQNNAGKSSLLQALLLFIEGKKTEPGMYFDPGSPITIAVRLESITDEDLAHILNEEHRKRFSEILTNGVITLLRRFETNGTSRLRWIARVPLEERFRPTEIDIFLSGKKPGTPFAEELTKIYPEIQDKVGVKTNQTQARSLIEEVVSQIPNTSKCDSEMDLPSGIDNSVRPLLPEPIYIPAVKDLADEIATKESASFGKLLSILLNQIAPELENVEETFKLLRKSLNRIKEPDGTMSDSRLEAVRSIEDLVQTHVRENFPKIELDIRIPPPEIKAVLSAAQIWIDDGVPGLVDSKGDGLKRSVTFAILRSFVELRRMQKLKDAKIPTSTNYLFLFEEPELYLHPNAQKTLFDALTEISKVNHVFVSTHSPLFFSPGATGTFVKLAKQLDASVATKPFSVALSIDLRNLDSKSQFQIISYETNNIVFFSDTVVLLEGDSDLILFPHIARTLNPNWAPERVGISLCRIGGKGNISRYREFFGAFKARVCVIADLDCLAGGFEHLQPSPECVAARVALLQTVDRIVGAGRIQGIPRSRQIREMQASAALQEQFRTFMDTIDRRKRGEATDEEVQNAEEQFFADRIADKRLQVLEDSQDKEVIGKKREILRLLRKQDVYILEKGDIESYYPGTVTGPDKPSRAIRFCNTVTDRDAILRLCDEAVCADGTTTDKEFNVIFSGIFGNVLGAAAKPVL
jgi:energy-coupling factor transporter ATP-binding protein EcfA2